MRMALVLIAGLLLAISVPAYADCGGGNGSEDPPSQGCGPGDNGGGEDGGEGSGDATATVTDSGNSTNTNTNDLTAEGGNATVIIGGYGGECYEGECEGSSGTLNSNAENNVDVSNDSTSNSDSTSTSDATVNNSGNTDVDVVVEGSNYEAARIPVNSAPPSFSGICNSGAAGGGKSLSISIAVSSDMCSALAMADAFQAVGDEDEVAYWLKRAARHAKWKGNMGLFRTIITIGIL